MLMGDALIGHVALFTGEGAVISPRRAGIPCPHLAAAPSRGSPIPRAISSRSATHPEAVCAQTCLERDRARAPVRLLFPLCLDHEPGTRTEAQTLRQNRPDCSLP